ncbi:hypothetical protein T265_09739 [Opisthorchis viverrini]|uniref:Uncharacterized protein n=1 Tax=Opisthorchis viverrini TaxID=6198 RepID=A0A074Z928_OPIVI|nr:hypothetical protein T265_09739 [Opisthorchis viverrini]KER22087.1 hypothetical protein T265_09739 [Opisthorchis viverrini]
MKKLQGYGIGGDLVRWLKLFLHDRRSKVRVTDHCTDWYTSPSGVPQGTVLGPLLFLLIIIIIIIIIINNNSMTSRLCECRGTLSSIAQWVAEVRKPSHHGYIADDGKVTAAAHLATTRKMKSY